MVNDRERWVGRLIDVLLRYRMGWRVKTLEEDWKRKNSQAVVLADASVSVDAM